MLRCREPRSQPIGRRVQAVRVIRSSLGRPDRLTRNTLAPEQTLRPPFFRTSGSQWKLSELTGGGHGWMLTCTVRCTGRTLLSDRLLRLRLMSIQLVRLRGTTRLYTKYSCPVKVAVRSSMHVIHPQTNKGSHPQPNIPFPSASWRTLHLPAGLTCSPGMRVTLNIGLAATILQGLTTRHKLDAGLFVFTGGSCYTTTRFNLVGDTTSWISRNAPL